MKIKYIIICSLVLSIIAGCSIQKNIAVRENSTNKKSHKNDSEKMIKVTHQPAVYLDDKDIKIEKVKNEDINKDGKVDRIEYTTYGKVGEGYHTLTLKINDSIISLYVDNPSPDFNIVDINPNDKFKEIDIYDDGPSDDPKTTFFIYDGKQIIKVGKILANEYMIDKNSKIFTNLDEINFFKPGINVGWTELDHNHKFTYKTLEKDQFINKQYEIAYERDSEKNPWRIYTDSKSSQYEENYIATVNQGDTVTVLDIIRQGERDIAFMLKLNNGKEGWINLFNGD